MTTSMWRFKQPSLCPLFSETDKMPPVWAAENHHICIAPVLFSLWTKHQAHSFPVRWLELCTDTLSLLWEWTFVLGRCRRIRMHKGPHFKAENWTWQRGFSSVSQETTWVNRTLNLSVVSVSEVPEHWYSEYSCWGWRNRRKLRDLRVSCASHAIVAASSSEGLDHCCPKDTCWGG